MLLQFLNPIWLWLSAGIVIPVAIHLWNIRQARILRIGSTMLIAEATQKSASSLKISQWLLLALRCLLIIALAMMIAEPSLRSEQGKSAKGWVVFDKAQTSVIYKSNQKTIDSFLSLGYELHDISKGFPAFKIGDSLKTDTTASTSAWALINKLDQALPAGFNVQLFPGNMMTSIGSLLDNPAGRPEISINLVVTSTNNSDTSYAPAFSIARQLNDQSLYQSTFLTSDEGSYFETKSIATVNSAIAFTDTSTLTIAIYQKAYPDDLSYLNAALNAILKLCWKIYLYC
ncbi:MAG: hypothetical protein EOO02_16580 [Chitinophagaceae bacterium]|nr:MAG: hypothetical protein EOO02_16580 [Chitinophagaceae bacterium]